MENKKLKLVGRGYVAMMLEKTPMWMKYNQDKLGLTLYKSPGGKQTRFDLEEVNKLLEKVNKIKKAGVEALALLVLRGHSESPKSKAANIYKNEGEK